MIQQTHTVIVERSSHSGRIPELYNKLAGMYDLFTDHEPSHHKAAVQMVRWSRMIQSSKWHVAQVERLWRLPSN